MAIVVIWIAAAHWIGQPTAAQQWLTDANQRIDQHRKANLAIQVVDSGGQPVSDASVHVAMKRHAFGFGTAVPASWILSGTSNGVKFREALLENFNHVVFENDLKYPPWIGLWGPGFSWQQTQQALDWLDSNNLPARGHYLSWATWSGNDAWGNSQNVNTLPQRIFDHISDKLPTVGTRVFEWDVINHPVGWLNDTYENRVEAAGLYAEGLDFYVDIVNHARQIINRPESEGGLGGANMPLWINEDDIIAGNSRANDYERIIDYLIANGAAPDGIGFQSHFIQEWGRISSPQQVYNRIDRFANKGVPLRSTEFDIDVGTNEAYQAQLMRDYLTIMFSHPAMEAITLWGFWQGSHWRPSAALYRSNWSEKPSLTAYQDLVLSQWWTDVVGTANESGEYLVRGFKGEYDITVQIDGEEHTVSVVVNEDKSITVSLPFSIALSGDYNQDGIVDAADYVVWRKHEGTATDLPNDNGIVGAIGAEHYELWLANYGSSNNSSPSGAVELNIVVPEPAAWLIAVTGACLISMPRQARLPRESTAAFLSLD